MTTARPTPPPSQWSWPGLALALGAPAAIVAAAHLAPASLPVDPHQAVMMVEWGAAIGLVVLVLALERRPLASIGLGRFTGGSLVWGLALGAAAIMLYPACIALQKAIGLPASEMSATATAAVPLWFRASRLLTAGVTEEILFRGYPMTRLRTLTGSRVLAFVLPWLVFTLLHIPNWGLAHLIYVGAVGAVFAAVFAWRGDLWTNIVGHVVTDAVPLLLLPMLAGHR